MTEKHEPQSGKDEKDIAANQNRNTVKSGALPPSIAPKGGAKMQNPLDWKYKKKRLSDYFTAVAIGGLRLFADTFFRERHGHRAVVLETVAAVPGMVGSMHNHLLSLRRMKHDNGLVRMLMDEAENERMHLLTFVEVAKPSLLERMMISATQIAFLGFFTLAYTFNKRAAHRFIGMLEEEAVESYTHYLDAIDSGKIENIDAPQIAKDYWKLPDDAKLRDVVLMVRDDEAEHRDVNHACADKLELVIANRRAEKKRMQQTPLEKSARKTLRRAQKMAG